jgi:hypothetical protein
LFPELDIKPFTTLVGVGEEPPTETENVELSSIASTEVIPREMITEPANPSICVCRILNYLNGNSTEKPKEIPWKSDIEFTTIVRQLVIYCPELLVPLLSVVMNKLQELCKSLRSVVVKSAVFTTSDLFLYLHDRCLQDGTDLVTVIIQKTGSEKQFVRDECISCLKIVGFVLIF